MMALYPGTFDHTSSLHFNLLCSFYHAMWVPVTTACCILGLRMEETASRYGGQLRIYWISSRGKPTVGGYIAWAVGRWAKNSWP